MYVEDYMVGIGEDLDGAHVAYLDVNSQIKTRLPSLILSYAKAKQWIRSERSRIQGHHTEEESDVCRRRPVTLG
jgi:hypothetical protein